VRKLVWAGAVLALAGAAMLVPVGGFSASGNPAGGGARPMPSSETSAERPKKPLSILFIHHSVGGRWLADAGPRQRIAEEIWKSHPEGGGARTLLEREGYKVDEVSYGSELGENTDDGDWLPKFRDKLDKMAGHQIVMFKSCFPNNQLDDDAALEKAKSSLSALLPIFAKHPEMLFVRVTTPPLAPTVAKEPAWKFVARMVLGKPQPGPRLARSGPLARKLDDWMTAPDGWLKDYPGKNVAVFDFYDILTDHGKSNFLVYPTGDGTDSHPSRAGNERAAAELVPFLNRAVRRAGLSE
jgi:hypothetical protein